MKKPLVAVFACALALGMMAFLPADISPISSAYAKGGGGGGGGGGTVLLPGVRAAGPIHGASALDGHPCPSPPFASP
ncbi:hypothetical protein EQ845_23965, partial [Pseudomonas putida]